MQNDEHLKQQLAVLGERYLTRTLSEIPRIDELVAQFDAGSPTAVKELERAAHKIHGSGAMFGFGDLSAQAGEVEHLAVRLAQSEAAGPAGEPSKDVLRQQLVTAVARLRKVASEAASTVGIDTNAR